jgi:HlyD family secretion protein
MDALPQSFAVATLESYMARITTRSKMIYWTIIVIISSAAGALPFIYTDVAVIAPGYFQSEIERQKILIPLQGRVLRNSVVNGSKVTRGDTLLIIDSEGLRARKEAVLKKISDNNSAISDLELLTNTEGIYDTIPPENFLTGRYFSEYTSMTRALTIQDQKLRNARSVWERNEALFRQELVAAADHEKDHLTLRNEEEGLHQVIISYSTQWQSDLMQRESLKVSLAAELQQCDEELENRIITAPVSGEIIQSVDIQVGSFAGPGQQVAEISPDGQLIAACLVSPDDIGLLNPGQKVRIQVSAFNYTEWGLLEASIIDISNDLVGDQPGAAYFRVRCQPERSWLELKNGFRADLKKGMSFTARIIVTRRSLFNLLFDKVDKWLNPNMNSMDR